MGLITANGFDVIETDSGRPRIGAWHFDLLVDSPDALTGKATIDINNGTLTFVGTATRSGVFSDTGHIRVVAGNAGLSTSGTPRHYNGTSLGIVLRDLLATAGEALSPTVDGSILAAGLDAWTTTATPIGTLISLLLAASGIAGLAWRMLPDGTLWVGVETWQDAGIDQDTYQIFEDSPEQNSMVIGVDAPLDLIGTTFEGRKVSYVEDSVGQLGAGVTMRIYFEEPTAINDLDRMRKALSALVQNAAARTDKIDFGRKYPAVVVSQSGSTIDVAPEQVNGKDLLDSMGNVPLWLGVPGARVEGITGGRVLVGWTGGDPSKPYATLFDGGETPAKVTLGVAVQLLLGGAAALPALAGTPHQAAEATLVAGLLAAFTTLGAAATGPLAGLEPGFAAAVTAVTAFQTTAAGANNFLATKVSVL